MYLQIKCPDLFPEYIESKFKGFSSKKVSFSKGIVEHISSTNSKRGKFSVKIAGEEELFDRCFRVNIANGDIVSAESALRCLKWTGADGLMIGRATFGDPWIFQQVSTAWEGTEIPDRPCLSDRVDIALEQFEMAKEDKGEHIACLEARKHFAWYLRGVSHSSYYKTMISSISTMSDIYEAAAGVKRDLK